MAYEPNPLNWQGAVQWLPENTYVLNALVVYTPTANAPGNANLYQCTTAVTVPGTTPDVDTTHWLLVGSYLTAPINDSDTFFRFRTTYNANMYALQNVNYRLSVDEIDIENILTNNLTGYSGPRAGLQTRLTNDETNITNILSNNMAGYSAPNNGLQVRLTNDELAITNILSNNMAGYAAPNNGLQVRLTTDETNITNILSNNMAGYAAPNNGLQVRLTTDESNITALQTAGFFLNRGAWAASTTYIKGDVVSVAPFGSLYSCAVNNTSSASFANDLAAGDWVLLLNMAGVVLNYTLQTASFNALTGYSYFIDCTAAAINISLPLTPNVGDPPITITLVAGDPTVNLVTLLANGNYIMGVQANMQVDKANASFRLVYAGGTYGWRTTIL